MATTRIEWADKVWNPITGCTPISDGCEKCYAKRMAARLAGRFGYDKDNPFKVTLHHDRWGDPGRWVKPKRIFVGSMGDIFHWSVKYTWVRKVFDVVRDVSKKRDHTFIFLTKRPDYMWACVEQYIEDTGLFPGSIWVGVTAENQEMADERIPALMAAVPVTVRFVSVEPMLEPVKLPMIDRLDWVICGAETGPGARPMKIEWAVDLYKQCQAAGVPFFFKKSTFNDQWSGLHDQVHGVRELPYMAR